MKQMSRIAFFVGTLVIFGLIQSVSACTIFMASSGDGVLAGNNEDWYIVDSYIQFIPGDEGEYGQVYFGTTEWYAEGGMNTEGLFYDVAAIAAVAMNDHPEKSWLSKWPPVVMLESCKNVSEAIQLFNSSRFDTSISYQLLVADRNGDAVVFAPGADGEWHFLLKDSEEYLVVTNFNLETNPDYTGCIRYNTATNMLEDMGLNLSIEYFTEILEAVHNPPGGGSETIYSNICDLVNGDIYLFYMNDYSSFVQFDLEEELELGSHLYKIENLFPEETSSVTTVPTSSSTHMPPEESLIITVVGLVGGAAIGLVALFLISRRM